MTTSLRIAIDAQFETGGASGGIEQFTATLLRGLGALTDGSETYVIVCPPEARGTWEPLAGSNIEIHTTEPRKSFAWISSPAVRRIARTLRRNMRGLHLAPLSLPDSEGIFEHLGADVVHFPHQLFRHSPLPTIYNPHDLQHRHLPAYFSRAEITWRDFLYEAGCRQATAVVVSSSDTKTSLLNWLEIDEAKINRIPHASPDWKTPDARLVERFRQELGLPGYFAFFPAQPWPHKNHMRLLEALFMLREESDIRLNVVLTGVKNTYWPAIAARIAELDLDPQVHFLGYRPERDIRLMYAASALLVLPSLFEGTGLPILEALASGTAIACSDIAVLREYAGDAAIYFDPSSPTDLAGALKSLVTDESFRHKLGEQARARAQHFGIDHMAMAYRALYRSAAGHT